MITRKVLTVLIAVLLSGNVYCAESQQTLTWPHPIPCRTQDSTNPDLFVMTLGDVQTPIAQGVFDPVEDTVTFRDGTVVPNYYRDVLGVKFYQPLDKSIFPLPPSGWCTWYYYYTRINAEEVRRNAEWIAANLKDYGAEYVQIDDGWQGTGARGSARNWEVINTNRFPGGMEALAHYIKSLGLSPGLWIAPHGQNNDDVVNAHPGVFLLKPDGSTASDTWEGRFLMDPTHPDSAAYLGTLFSRMSGWGYDYFKIDGQPIVVEEYRSKKEFMHLPSDDADGLYRNTLGTIREAIGPDRYLLGCWGIPLEGAGIMNGSRTGGDVVIGWGGFQVALRPTLQYFYLHNIVWYSDPDVVLVRPPLSMDQARVWATLQGLTGQALMSSDRLMDLSDDRVELLRRIYPATDIRPLDLFPTERYKKIWDLKVNHLGRHYDVVGVFNFDSEQTDSVYLNWRELGLPEGQLIHVYDFWNKEYLGAWAEGMVVPTAPTSCRVLTLLPANDGIQLISTSRHITQGPVDLVDLEAGSSGDSFQGASHLIKHDPYQLTFVFPRGTNYAISTATARVQAESLPVRIANHQGWATVEIVSPGTQTAEWEVHFEPADRYDFPPSTPANVFAQRVGLDGVDLHWQEQYYLNAGYHVYLDGQLLGQTPEARFPVRNLDPQQTYAVQVSAVWDNGKESELSKAVQFSVASLLPDELSLAGLEPTAASGRWAGFEIEELLSASSLSVAGANYGRGLNAFANSEITFNLHRLFDTFTVSAGIDDRSRENAEAEFAIMGDGRELWQSGRLKRGEPVEKVTLAVKDVQELTLRTTPSSSGRGRDQIDWIDPLLTRSPK